MDVVSLQNVDQIKADPQAPTTENESVKGNSKKKRNGTCIEVDVSDQNYAAKRNIAEGMMDLALLTANSNQLRFILTYNTESSTFYISLGLITLSLVLQVAVGIGLILKRKNTSTLRSRRVLKNQFLVVGVFIITFVNVLIATFTATGTDKKS